jgi:hypothetical protein
MPKDVEPWLKVGITYVKDIAKWREFGVNPKQALRYIQQGYEPEDIELIKKKRVEKQKGSIRKVQKGVDDE